ncbi:DUF3108 domain-containing protein [Halobacteriovorax sp. GB3]|uniref:DUF3108 domain-containing protein n=1 Tax=Halobacteriovorax sp. GB3 TaxID=2719615 RepID=UPI0023609D50|nr:DUF3108 domain-containing protein [Halobacteriovorax sp. GB3]MDD0854091.1 DUF3108 domain-containing protein [Halobacteriovorax sp. GB3]
MGQLLRKKLPFLSIAFSVFLLSSCATKDDRLFDENEKQANDLVEVFKLDEKNFNKFKVTKIAKKKTVAQSKVEEKKETALKNTPKKKINKKVKSKPVPEQKKVSETLPAIKQENVQKDLSVVKTNPNFIYPDDYPEIYKDYDRESKKTWKKRSPLFYEGEEFTIAVRYLGITAGHIKLQSRGRVMLGDKEAYHVKGILKSASFYEYVYKLEDTVETFMATDNLIPLKYTLFQRESGQNVDDLQVFDQDKLKTYFWYKRVKDGKIKKREKNEYIPRYFQDSFSALYFARGLPLKIGDEYRFPVVTRAKLWMLKMKVDKRESIVVNGKKYDALKIKAETRFPGVLKKKGDIIFWYSADETRKLLKFEAKVKIGAIEGELINYKTGDKIE